MIYMSRFFLLLYFHSLKIIEVVKKKHIVILSNKISEKNKYKLKLLLNEFFEIEFFECNSLVCNYKKFIHNSRLNETVFARLYVIKLFEKFDKVLYLDSDVIFNDSIDKIFQIGFDKPIFVVPDIFIETFRNISSEMGMYLEKDLGLTDQDRYFNSGVIMFDIQKCQKYRDFTELADLLISRTFVWEDQDVLNKFFARNFSVCDYRWNLIWLQNNSMQAELMKNEQYRLAYKNPAIIHYAGGALPIKCPRSRFGGIWWKNARHTPFYLYFIRCYALTCIKLIFKLPFKFFVSKILVLFRKFRD